MGTKHVGKQTLVLTQPPSIIGHAAVAGQKEGEGPLKNSFDYISDDSYFGEETWEKAESAMQKRAFSIACDKAKQNPSSVQFVFAGDLLNQCTASAFSMRDSNIPFFGLYGACSTMAEGLCLASMAIDGAFASITAVVTSSHFCSAERQFRLPLEYGGQRTPTSQWTATASGAAILQLGGTGPRITHITVGRIVDAGICDANNMGAAMAPAAYDTLCTHFSDLNLCPQDYDLIVTGDLGYVGRELLLELFTRDGTDLASVHKDCGLLLFDRESQDVHAGASGCGCSASVLCGYLLNGMRAGRWKRLLFAATGALMSPTSSGQKQSIPGICHAVTISME